MGKKIVDNIKALFPDGVEAITITKNDYDRLCGELTYQNIVLQQENEKLKELCDKYEEEHNTTFKEWQDIIEEHKIMKQLIIENGLWERLLNDDRFLKHLRSDD